MHPAISSLILTVVLAFFMVDRLTAQTLLGFFATWAFIFASIASVTDVDDYTPLFKRNRRK